MRHLPFARLVTAAVFAAAAAAAHAANCDALDGCAAKACRIDAQLDAAKAAGNAKQVAGLTRARGEIAHCSDDGLKAKRAMALAQAQKKIDARNAELARAQATGDAKKVARAQKKLDNAQSVYKELEASPL